MSTSLINSRRIVRTSSYTPVRLRAAADERGDLVNVAGLIRSLEIVPGELDGLTRRAVTDQDKASAAAIAALVRASSADQILNATASLDDVRRSDLIGAVEYIRSVRAAALASATAALSSPRDTATPGPAGGADQLPGPTPDALGSAGLQLPLWTLAASRWKMSVPADVAFDIGSASAAMTWRPRSASADAAAISRVAAPVGAPPALGPAPVMRARSAEARGSLVVMPGMAIDLGPFLSFVEPYIPPGTDLATLDPLDALAEIDRKTIASNIVVDALSRRDLQPLGLLHLETLEMTPADVQRGELVYSLPLAPHEKVTLSHKEWAVRESEFSEFVQDSMENYSERGVVETDEIAIASQSESRKTERTGMGSSGGVVMTGPADAGSTVVTNSRSEQQSKRHAQTVTSQASSRSVRDHKVSFTVATVTGTEDFTSRLIENTRDDRAMRIDYFRRMKSWQVELYRTGVRLAYDVVIPDPGRRLRTRQELIRNYDRALSATFDPGLNPADIDRDRFMKFAKAYGVALPAPPMDADTSSVYQQWQMACYAALRDGAYAKFTQVQERIRQRRAELSRQIDTAADADTLRLLEREEIARLTLAWLVPGFPGAGSVSGAAGEPQGLSDASWQQALEFGEYIKFVHAAIDWERLAYFLYPYFWSDRQVDRLYLRHPDPTHREFLRAGAARVVIPILPGFEEELTTFVDKGKVGKLPDGHRFGEVVAAVRKANETFIAGAGGDDDAAGNANPDVKALIGSWTEFTPTGALDIDVVTMAVQAL